MRRAQLAVTALLIVGANDLEAQPATFIADTLDVATVSVSPDGRYTLRIAKDTKGRVLLRTAGAATERVVVDLPAVPGSIAWSLDGRSFAIGIPDSAGKVVATSVIRVSDGRRRTLDVVGNPMGWTRSGELLVTARGTAAQSDYLVLVSPTGEATAIYESGGTAAIAPDGTHFFAIERGRLVRIDRKTGVRRTVTASDANEEMPILSPDGKSIAFASDKDGDWGLYVAVLGQLPIRDAVRIGDIDGWPSRRVAWWTTDGTLVLRTANFATELYRIDVVPENGHARGRIERLTRDAADNEDPVVSPNSRRIAFSSNGTSKQGIGVMDMEGGSVRVLPAPFTRYPTLLGWTSPDEVLFEDTYSEHRGLRTYDFRTGTVSSQPAFPIAGRSKVHVPSRGEVWYLPPGAQRDAMTVRALSLSTGRVRDVASIDFIRQFSVSPDARLLAYATLRPGSPSELYIRNIETGADRLLLKETTLSGVPWPMSWSPNGKYFFYFDLDDAIRMVNVDSGESWTLIDETDMPDWGYNEATWSPDGSYLVVVGEGNRLDSVLRRWCGLTAARIGVRATKANTELPFTRCRE